MSPQGCLGAIIGTMLGLSIVFGFILFATEDFPHYPVCYDGRCGNPR